MLVDMKYGSFLFVAGAMAVGCGKVTPPATQDAAMADDAAIDAAGPACDVTKPFGSAIEVPGLHDPNGSDVHATLTEDELTIYFGTTRDTAVGAAPTFHIYSATRTTRDGMFGKAGLVGPTFSQQGESHPSITPDGNTIYFDSGRTIAGGNVFSMSRSSAGVAFSTLQMVKVDFLISPAITADGKVLYASNLQSGFLARLTSSNGAFGNPETVDTGLSLSVTAAVTRDELTLYFSLGDTTGNDIYVARRATTSAAWEPSEVTELKATTTLAEPSWISADGCRLYLTYRMGNGNSIIYLATRPK